MKIGREALGEFIPKELREITASVHNQARARAVNPFFDFVSTFFDSEKFGDTTVKSLPDVVNVIIYNTFRRHSKIYNVFSRNCNDYVREEIRNFNLSEVERYMRQALTMEAYIPLLALLIKKHLDHRRFSQTTRITPFSPLECEILSGLVLDSFGLNGNGRNDLQKIEAERGWNEGTGKYWVDFSLEELRGNYDFLNQLTFLWKDAQNARIIKEDEIMFPVGDDKRLKREFEPVSYSN